MATSLEIGVFEPILRELYPKGFSEEMTMKNHPLLSMVQQRTDFGSRNLHIPVRSTLPQGAAATSATAYANRQASRYQAFDVTPVNFYAHFQIDGEVVDRSRFEPAGLVDSLQTEIDGVLESTGHHLGHQVYRSGSGSFAQVGSGTSSPITLKNIEDIYFVEVGMKFTANDTDDTTSPRSGVGTVTTVNADAGTITYSGTITGLAVDDYLFIEGSEGLLGTGLAGYCPATAPTDSLFGVNRINDPERLGGIRLDASNYTMDEVLIRANARALRAHRKHDYYFINPADLADFEVAKEGHKFVTSARDYSFGIDGIQAYGVKLIPDANCQVGTMWGINMKCFGWATMGKAPRLFDNDGLKILRSGGGVDKFEGTVVVRHNWWCNSPYDIMRVTLPART